jgi:signal transduction histidine kinase
MRRQLVLSTLRTAGKTLLFLAVPVLALQGWVVAYRPDLAEHWYELSQNQRLLWVMVYYFAILIGCFLVAAILSYRESARFAAPLVDLAAAAERLGRGQTQLEPVHSGIAEIDRVSAVLSRSAQQLARSLAAERDFASDASHQLRTPLTALLMRLEEIADTDDPSVVKEEATVAIAQVERLTSVVDDLMMRTRRTVDPGQHAVSLDAVIASLQQEWQPAFEKARRSIYVHGERGLQVRGTASALSQVLSTLLENSLVHGRGTVSVDVRRSGPSVVIEVTDQGDGVPAAIAPRIFERSVSSGRGKSTGVGLALARDLAESIGGRLDLTAAVPATFSLFLSEARARPVGGPA